MRIQIDNDSSLCNKLLIFISFEILETRQIGRQISARLSQLFEKILLEKNVRAHYRGYWGYEDWIFPAGSKEEFAKNHLGFALSLEEVTVIPFSVTRGGKNLSEHNCLLVQPLEILFQLTSTVVAFLRFLALVHLNLVSL